MTIKTTRDGRLVTVKDGNIYVGDTCMGATVVPLDSRAKAKLASVMPDAAYCCKALLLTDAEAQTAIQAIKARNDKLHQDRLDLEASMPQYRVLVARGAYYVDKHIATVCVTGNTAINCVDMPEVKVATKTSKTAREIMDGDRSEYRYCSGESMMWIITPEQEQAIIAECGMAKVAKEAAKKDAYIPAAKGFGYCYSCDSYCMGDCDNYQPKPTKTQQVQKFGRENN